MRKERGEFDGHPLECSVHPGRVSIACGECFAQLEESRDPLRLRIVAAARELLGVPFQHGGRSRGGVDCSGVVALTVAAVGLSPRDDTNYPDSDAWPDFRARFIRSGMALLPELRALPGDVLVMRRGKLEKHVAIVTEFGGIIHARRKEGVARVVEHKLEYGWASFVSCVLRFPELVKK